MVVAFLFVKISSYVTDILVEGEIVKKEEHNLYCYCLEGLFEMVGNLFLTIFLGILFGKLIDTLIFLFIFISIRTLAGGYHAKDGNMCFVISILLFFAVIMSAQYFQSFFQGEWSVRSYIVSSFCIFLLAPVDCKNKRLDKVKKKRLKIWTLIFLILISLLYFYMFLVLKWQYCIVISNCMFVIVVLLVMGYLENLKEENFL